MKKAIVFLLAIGICIGFAACSSEQNDETDITRSDNSSSTNTATDGTTASDKGDTTDTTVSKTTYSLNSKTAGVKLLGVRNEPSEKFISCDWSCSGFEMNVNCLEKGDIIFHASANAGCYFRAYVDGAEWGEYYVVDTTLREIVLKDVPSGTHTVRLIKVTGHTLSCAQVVDVCFAGSISENTPAQKELYIEFVGDSICCGWGMVGTKDGQYTGQDGSLAYPYLVAEAMNADYSITALSGQGLLKGAPGMTNGYLMTSPKRSSSNYNFERTADVVVINIGTNDYAYRDKYGITSESFGEAYMAFLRTVREKNPKCKIICIYNTMNDTWSDALKGAVEIAGGEASGIFLVKFDRASVGHPNIAEQTSYASVLKPVIESALEQKSSGVVK
ncbi:MAG: GDSL-type esterase/lipase family protein [Eubacteriales bacterium]